MLLSWTSFTSMCPLDNHLSAKNDISLNEEISIFLALELSELKNKISTHLLRWNCFSLASINLHFGIVVFFPS